MCSKIWTDNRIWFTAYKVVTPKYMKLDYMDKEKQASLRLSEIIETLKQYNTDSYWLRQATLNDIRDVILQEWYIDGKIESKEAEILWNLNYKGILKQSTDFKKLLHYLFYIKEYFS